MIVMLMCAALAQDGKIRELLQKADGQWAQREKPGMAEAAVETFQKALALDETCVDAYWKIARAYLWVGGHEKNEERRQKLYREGIDFCKMAVSINPDCIDAHFWL